MLQTRSRYSLTVKKLGGYSFSGTMPIIFFTPSGSFVTSMPITVALPDVGPIWPVSMEIVVLFPAPLGPSRQKDSPCFDG